LGNILVGRGDYDKFGRTVSLSGNGMKLAVGARIGSESTYSGRIEIFLLDRVTSQWNRWGGEIEGQAEYDYFASLGNSAELALSSDGTVVAGGSPRHGSKWDHAGHVRVFHAQPH